MLLQRKSPGKLLCKSIACVASLDWYFHAAKLRPVQSAPVQNPAVQPPAQKPVIKTTVQSPTVEATGGSLDGDVLGS